MLADAFSPTPPKAVKELCLWMRRRRQGAGAFVELMQFLTGNSQQ